MPEETPGRLQGSKTPNPEAPRKRLQTLGSQLPGTRPEFLDFRKRAEYGFGEYGFKQRTQ